MTHSYKCFECLILHGINRILSKFYWKIIEIFFRIAYPIKYLQKKESKFVLTKKCENNFHQLKPLLTTSPMLKIANPDGKFTVCTDACEEAIGGVLMWDEHVNLYESRKLKEHEINYYTHAIIHVVGPRRRQVEFR